VQIDGYVQALQDDVQAVAAVGDEATARAARLLAVALQSAFARRLLEALSEASLELEAQLEGARVEVRLAGSEPQLVVVYEDAAPPPADEAATARITLRLPERLKGRIEEAAVRDGMSVNTWIVHALTRGAEPRRQHHAGRRLTGFGQS
jgi:HicB-like protein involved in pilus formation